MFADIDFYIIVVGVVACGIYLLFFTISNRGTGKKEVAKRVRLHKIEEKIEKKISGLKNDLRIIEDEDERRIVMKKIIYLEQKRIDLQLGV